MYTKYFYSLSLSICLLINPIHAQSDADLDGIIDDLDLCPDTPLEAIVDEHGCTEEQLAEDYDNDAYDNLYEIRAGTDLNDEVSFPNPGFVITVSDDDGLLTEVTVIKDDTLVTTNWSTSLGQDESNAIVLTEGVLSNINIGIRLTHESPVNVRLYMSVSDSSEISIDVLYLDHAGHADTEFKWYETAYLNVQSVDDILSDGDIFAYLDILNSEYLMEFEDVADNNYKSIMVPYFHFKVQDDELPMDSDGDGVLDGNDGLPFNGNEIADSDGDGWGDGQDNYPNDSRLNPGVQNILIDPGFEDLAYEIVYDNSDPAGIWYHRSTNDLFQMELTSTTSLEGITSYSISNSDRSAASKWAILLQNITLPENTMDVFAGGFIRSNVTSTHDLGVQFHVKVPEGRIDGTDFYKSIDFSQGESQVGDWLQVEGWITSSTLATPVASLQLRPRVQNTSASTLPTSEAQFDSLYVFANTTLDTDGDGIYDYEDPDDDNDGFLDGEDDTPLDGNVQADHDFDEDGIHDFVDQDDDNDGVPDYFDLYDTDSTRWQDIPTSNSDPVKIVVVDEIVEVAEIMNTESFGMYLSSAPNADVEIQLSLERSYVPLGLSTEDTTEVLISTNSLVFTPGNWDQTQFVDVTGLDDDDVDGDQYLIVRTQASMSTDPYFNGVDAEDIFVINADDKGFSVELIDGTRTAHADLNAAVAYSFQEEHFESIIRHNETKLGGYGTVLEIYDGGTHLWETLESTIYSHKFVSVGHQGSGHPIFVSATEYDNEIWIQTKTIWGPKDYWMKPSDIVKVHRVSEVELPYTFLKQGSDDVYYMYWNLMYYYFDSSVRELDPDYDHPNSVIASYDQAPEFMAIGGKYYSWDTHYYYTSPEEMVRDAAHGEFTNSINNGNIYINPYQWRDIREPSQHTVDSLFMFMEEIRTNTGDWEESLFYSDETPWLQKESFEAVSNINFNISIPIAVSRTESGYGRSFESHQDSDPYNHNHGHNYDDVNTQIRAWPLEWVHSLSTNIGYDFGDDGPTGHFENLYQVVIGRKGVGIGAKYNQKTKWAQATTSHYFEMDKRLGFLDHDAPVILHTIYGSDLNFDGQLDLIFEESSYPYDYSAAGLLNGPAHDLDDDGVPNAIDAFPGDPTEAFDLDGDGIGNNRDIDDDGDGDRSGTQTVNGTPLYWVNFDSFDSDVNSAPAFVHEINDTLQAQEDAIFAIPFWAEDDDMNDLIIWVNSDTSAVFAEYVDSVIYIHPSENWNGMVSIAAYVSDQQIMVSDTFMIEVEPLNDPPTLTTQLGTHIIDEDAFGVVVIPQLETYFSDVDSFDVLTFAGEVLDSGLDSIQIGPAGETILSGWDPNGSSGLLSLKRSDMLAASIKSEIKPIIMKRQDFRSKKGSLEQLNSKRSSHSKDELKKIPQHLIQRTNPGTPGLLTDNSGLREDEITSLIVYPTENFNGSVRIAMTASDDSGASVTDTLILMVQALNDPPQYIQTFPDTLELMEDGIWEHAFWAEDPDGDSLIYEIMTSDMLNAPSVYEDSLITIQPAENWFGAVQVYLSVSDLSTVVSDTMTLVIDSVNDAPTVSMPYWPPLDTLFADPADTVITFIWSSSMDVEGAEIQYTVRIETPGLPSTIYETGDTSLAVNITELTRNDTSWWEVTSSDGELQSSSEMWSFFVDAAVGLDDWIGIPTEFTLHQNYPNPFNPTTTLRYGLPESSDVKMVIYDLRGREVRHWIQKSQAAGWYELSWNGLNQDGTAVSTGVYLARIQAGSYSSVIKMVYLR